MISKNNSYKYGMLGEIYVWRNIKCPRCQKKLIRNKPGTPGTDFVCKNNHWFQLKSRNVKTYSYGKLLKLLGGSYTHQMKAIEEKNADFLVLLYNGNRVYNVFWLENNKIDRELVIPRTIEKKGKEYIRSLIVCNTVDLIGLELGSRVFQKKKNKKKNLKNSKHFKNGFPDYGGKKLNCNLCDGFCIHFQNELNSFLCNENNRKIVKDGDEYFLVDITEEICSCGSVGRCQHLQTFVQ